MPIIPPTAEAPGQAFPVVAIGASAGGLIAIEELLKALDPKTGMGFVIILHLAANHKSLYPEIIAKMTTMKVFEAQEGIVIQRNCVYVMPASLNLAVFNGTLSTTVRTESPGHNKPIDRFFFTLAASSKDQAIGIILSGLDGDGSEGCKSIKTAGGQIFVQDPATAVQDSMPLTAVHKGCGDFLGSPKQLAQELSRLASHIESGRFAA
jgi:two-component system, chemotaxis family, CheB/CheR fusion protein